MSIFGHADIRASFALCATRWRCALSMLAYALASGFVFVMMLSASAPASAGQAAVVLHEGVGSVDLWPRLTLREDVDGKLTLADVMAAPEKLQRPTTAYGTLGMARPVHWLHVPIEVTPGADSRWVFDNDYALIYKLDLYIVKDGKVLQQIALGKALPFTSRPLLSRTHSAPLVLVSGSTYDLYIRVETSGAMLLPLTLNTPAAFHQRAVNEQMLQGVVAAIMVGLLAYSLVCWGRARESMYLKNAAVVFGGALFNLHYFGIGDQFLWTDNVWVHQHAPGLGSVIATLGTILFVMDVLGSDLSRPLRLMLRILAGIFIVTGLAHALDLINVEHVSRITSIFGMFPALLALPGAVARARRSDYSGVFFVAGWAGYALATSVAISMLHGKTGVGFWTMHALQLGALFDMLVFMRIAVMRAADAHRAALRATRERDSLISLAHSDPLTGLLNRRGMMSALEAALPRAQDSSMAAVYVLDLDQFKPVNDRYGHDVGDELLIAIGQRLRDTLRGGDAVARFGGDEFVVLANALKNDKQARELGQKLLDAFRLPFSLSQHTCSVGITIGYALTPGDATDAHALLKSADAAMYAGKQSGKNCVRRIGTLDAQPA